MSFRVETASLVDYFTCNALDTDTVLTKTAEFADLGATNAVVNNVTAAQLQAANAAIQTTTTPHIITELLTSQTLSVTHPLVIAPVSPFVVPSEPTVITNAAFASITCPTLDANAVSVQTYQTDTFSAGNLTVSRVNLQNLTASGTVSSNVGDAQNTDIQTSTVSSIVANTTTTNNIDAATSVATSGSFVYNDTNGDYYSSPTEGVFRGVCFFQNLDIGIREVSTLISMNMFSLAGQPYIQGYNTFLGHIDHDGTIGGVVAILSLCAPTTPARTLRWETSGNLSIYSNGVLIWQNGSMVSDARLKRDVSRIEGAMEKIRALDGVTFKYNFDTFEESAGVVLEQARAVFPQCTRNGLVHLERLVPLLIEGARELAARNREISSLINARILHQSN